MKIFVFAFIIAEVFASANLTLEPRGNTTSDDVLSRVKRFLIFNPNGGTLKFVTGYLGPIDIPLFQNINCLRNLQFQYNLPPSVITTVPTFPGIQQIGSSTPGRGFSGSFKMKLKPDSSRTVAYNLVENILNREGEKGHECLLRAICQVAETPVKHNGLVGELLQIFFTPGKFENINDDYRHAHQAGSNHVDCDRLYSGCPHGHGILDSFSLVHEFKFDRLLQF